VGLAVREELEAYGRVLFMGEWKRRITVGEDARAVNAEGLREDPRLCDAA
jgi:hypothetical protein